MRLIVEVTLYPHDDYRGALTRCMALDLEHRKTVEDAQFSVSGVAEVMLRDIAASLCDAEVAPVQQEGE